jgi:hypothetical protein
MKRLLALFALSLSVHAHDCTVHVPAPQSTGHSEVALQLDLDQRLRADLARKGFTLVPHPVDASYIVESQSVSCDGVGQFFGETYCRRERQAYINIANSRTGALTIAQGRSRWTVRDAFAKALREIPRCRPGQRVLRGH